MVTAKGMGRDSTKTNHGAEAKAKRQRIEVGAKGPDAIEIKTEGMGARKKHKARGCDRNQAKAKECGWDPQKERRQGLAG